MINKYRSGSLTTNEKPTPYCAPASMFGTLEAIQDTKKHVILLLGAEITKASLVLQEKRAAKASSNLMRENSHIPLPSNYVQVTEHTGRLALITEGFNYDEDNLGDSIAQARTLFADYINHGELIAIATDHGPRKTDGTRYKLLWTSNE